MSGERCFSFDYSFKIKQQIMHSALKENEEGHPLIPLVISFKMS